MRPFFHSLLLSFRGIFYTLTGKNIAFANLQMGVVSKLWKFVTGFSIKIWLKFFGAVFLQPCFFAPKSFAVIAKRADPKRSALFLCASFPFTFLIPLLIARPLHYSYITISDKVSPLHHILANYYIHTISMLYSPYFHRMCISVKQVTGGFVPLNAVIL